MATATKSARTTVKPTTERDIVADGSAPLDVSASPPNKPTGYGPDNTPFDPTAPTLQESLRQTAAPTEFPTIYDSADSRAVARSASLARLDSLIVAHNSSFVTTIDEFGREVWTLVNVEMSTAVNEASRKECLSAALRQAELIAFARYDSSVSAKPQPALWLNVSGLIALCPNAKSLPSVRVARVFSTQIQRVETPDSWNAPVSYTWKAGRASSVPALIDQAVTERWTEKDAQTAVDALSGLMINDPGKKVDPIKGAESAARAIVERFNEGKVDPQTFFDIMANVLAKYGYVSVG
jgi:hypothetical protein